METIQENTTVGTEVITVVATDLDQGANQIITYSILNTTSVPFSIPDPAVRIVKSQFNITHYLVNMNFQIGTIVVSGSLDRETVSEYMIVVVARDSAENSETQEV